MAEYTNPYLSSNNPYLQGQIDSASNDVVRNYNLTTQPAYNTAMVKSGSFGNAGVQQMNDNAKVGLRDTLSDLAINMRGQDYRDQQNMYRWDNEFNRNLYNDAYGQNMNNLTTGVGLLGTMAGYNANDLANGTTIQNTPFNYWSQFSNAANSMANGFGTTTGTMSGGGSNPLMAGLGGMQLGRSLWGSGGGSGGSGNTDWVSGTGNYSQYTDPDYGQYL